MDTDGPGDRNTALLLEFIAHNDAPCKICGYNLRHLTRAVCPECGTPFQLDVYSRNPALGRWLLLMVPLLMTAGVGVLFCLLLLAWGRPSGRQATAVYGFILLGAVSAVAAFVAHRGKRRFFRLGRGWQWTAINACWAIVAVIWAVLVTR